MGGMGDAVSGLVDDDGYRCNLARMLDSVGKEDNADDVDESQAMDCGASTSVGVANYVPVMPPSRDVTGEDSERCHKLAEKHKIFLSHSGAQKSFVAALSEDLMRRNQHPFFDKLRSSLPVEEKFPHLIFDAIKQCKVGVVVLSEEFFTRSKWPMLELAAMVEESKTREPNRRINIIPAFYGISRDRCLNPDVHGEDEVDLRRNWREWEEEDPERIDVEKWKNALNECCGPHMGLIKRDGELDGRFRARIVEAVCKIVGPETRCDDSSLEGKTRLFKDISERIFKGGQPLDFKVGVHVVGLYGMTGVGKTTACKILCDELCGEYHDKVCHVEFGSAREEELLPKVLRELSVLDCESLEKLTVGECHAYLKIRLTKERVFLAMDNVTDESVEQARSLLGANFGDGSVVLVTARSMDQLLRLDVASENIFAMPDLDLEEAKSLFLNCAHLEGNAVGEEFVKTCLRRCYFSMSSDRKCYHPLALKVLGREVGDMIRGGEDERAVLSRIRDFNFSRRKEHPVFSILRSSFDSMLEEDQLLFLDVALDMGSNCSGRSIRTSTSMEWLCMVHGKDRDEVEDRLECLKRRSLLKSFGADEDGEWGYGMHDLWREFAKEEIKVGKFGDRRWVYEGEECRERVDLREYPKLEAVKLNYYGEDVVAVDVRGLKHLRSLVVEIESGVTSEVSGLGTLESLTYLRLSRAAFSECIAEVGLLTNLEVVDLSYFRGARLPDMSKLTSLRTLALVGSDSLKCISLQNHSRLSELDISGCSALRSVDISGCMSFKLLAVSFGLVVKRRDVSFSVDIDYELEELNLSSCPLISSLNELRLLRKLRKLDISGCSSIENLDDLDDLKMLEELRARACEGLAMLPECRLPNLRRLDIESEKVRIGFGSERGFPMLESEHEQAEALSSSPAGVTQNDEGEGFVTTYLPTGQSLSSDGKQDPRLPLKVSDGEECGSSGDEGETYSSSSTSGTSRSGALCNDLQQTEVLSDHEDLHSLFQNEDGIIVFCCFDTLKGDLEFYFRNAEEMASVAGVGTQYAKVVLVDGRKAVVREIPEMVWKETLGRVRSTSTIVYEAMTVVRSQGDVRMSKEFEECPLIWTIAEHFMFGEAVTKFTMSNNNDASSSNGGSGERTSQASICSRVATVKNALNKFMPWRRKREVDGDDEGNMENRRGPSDPEEALDRKSLTTVSVEFLPGGDVVQEVIKTIGKNKKEITEKRLTRPPHKTCEELVRFHKTIKPDLDIVFPNQGDSKEFQVTVSSIFEMDRDWGWGHDGWNLRFGLCEPCQQYGSVVRGSLKTLDVQERKITWNTSVETGEATGSSRKASVGGGVKVSVINASATVEASDSKDEHDTRQCSIGYEGSEQFTRGGLTFQKREQDKLIECQYFNPEGPYHFADSGWSHPSRSHQDVKFEGAFTVLETPEQRTPEFLEFKLTASRSVKEVDQEFRVSEYLEDVKREDVSTVSVQNAASGDEVIEISHNQKYEKRILVNHNMTHLDGKRHKLREASRGSNTTFTKVNGKEYDWSKAPLVKASP